ncbi:hypothetical protein L596_030116 [Steinernema carpocapsae]|uniref:Major facilitator superfamily (MFS) profile domain-containing protein n=1 Tax=Steinernema carpocapsae TaxID=34508 RepID=A0A4V5ZX95_STECR|nr:hypothetical protein L596_030116 [Steinernema carpocapsae]
MLCLFLIDSMKMNLGMAMVCMVNHTAFADHQVTSARNASPRCEKIEDVEGAVEAGYTGHLLWSPTMQSALFSAVFYGALATSLPSGYLADWFNSKHLLLLSLVVYTLTTLISPILAETSYTVFLINRVLMGLGEGSAFPTVISIAARWFPPADRGSMVALYTAGTQLAGIFSGFVSSSLCQVDFMGGWPLIFYVYGVMGVVWILLWALLGSSDPKENHWISEKEEKYITEALQHAQRVTADKREVPWLSIFTSLPFWAIGFAWFANNFGVAIIQVILPSYFRDVLQLDLKSNGLFTILPFVMQLITKLSSGVISDFIKRRGFLGHTATCKLFQSIGSFGTVFAYVGLLCGLF